MDNDDVRIGHLYSRREAVALLGAAGVQLLGGGLLPGSALAQAQGGTCVVRPAQTEGPYFVDEKLNRVDIRSDPSTGLVSAGIPLSLGFAVSRLSGNACTPLAGVLVDVWQCDEKGIYSGVKDPSFDTTGKKFLRGYQTTDAKGMVRFTTVYPGWYQGRTVHIHFKLRTAPAAGAGQEFTSQVYFDDGFTDQVFTRAPYASRGARSTRNNQDGIFRRDGAQLMLAVSPDGAGYTTTFNVAMQGV